MAPDKQAALTWLLAVFLFTFTGCASAPWGEIIDQDNTAGYRQIYTALEQKHQACGSGLDTEVILNFETRLDKRSVAGFSQFMQPAFFRMTVLNPLDQLVWAVAANSEGYQVLDVGKRLHSSGTLRSFAVRRDIPETFIRGSWFDWLTGRLLSKDSVIKEVRLDTEQRGVWYTLMADSTEELLLEHVLIDPERSLLLERIILDKEGASLATIAYDDWTVAGACLQPADILITGLSFGAKAQLKFSDPRSAEFLPADFTLPAPPGYVRKVYP